MPGKSFKSAITIAVYLQHYYRIEKVLSGKYTVGDEDEAVSRLLGKPLYPYTYALYILCRTFAVWWTWWNTTKQFLL